MNETDDFNNGVRYALEYLSEIYDGIIETDIWADYMTKEEKGND